MRNDIGLCALFGVNMKSKQLFYKWCQECKDLCEYDRENIEIDLFVPCINNLQRYFHFNHGNILDWLEEQGYYIGLPLRGNFKYVTVVHKNTKGDVNQTPIYSNSGVKSRTRALELGVMRAIEDLETNLSKL